MVGKQIVAAPSRRYVFGFMLVPGGMRVRELHVGVCQSESVNGRKGQE